MEARESFLGSEWARARQQEVNELHAAHGNAEQLERAERLIAFIHDRLHAEHPSLRERLEEIDEALRAYARSRR